MFKRSVIIVGFGVILAAVLGRETSADTLIIGGRVFKHSLRADIVAKQVGNLAQTPVIGESSYTVTVVRVTCQTRSGNVIQGEPARVNEVQLNSSVPLEQTATEKRKGRAHGTVVTSTDIFLDPQFCTSHQMIPVEAEVQEMEAVLQVSECIGEDIPETTEDERCSTSVPKSFMKLACTGSDLEPGDEYSCVQLLLEHLGHDK